jgi:N-acetylglucosaminyl-diphospho-decaprenol L-rhamnosyltransferase
MKKVNIAILNYNGKDLLRECLPSIVGAASISRHSCKVTVVDNRSTDDSVDFVRGNFPGVDVIVAKENRVYFTYNEIAGMIDDDIMVVMNNDIKVDSNYVDPMIEPFIDNDNVFFVACRGYSFDGKRYEGDKARVSLRWGVMEPNVYYDGYEKDVDVPGYTFSAGVAAFDRGKFLELGGYDDIYFPGRYEDVDLCYRGWKRGWVGIYCPRSVHYHKGGASFNRDYRQKQIAGDVFRNSVIFMVKNVRDPRILSRALLLSFMRAVVYVLIGRAYMSRGFVEAVRKIPEALNKRKLVSGSFLIEDKDVISKINEGKL